MFEDPDNWNNGDVVCDVAGVLLNMIIDTGATINAITKEQWEKLQAEPSAKITRLDTKTGKKILAYASLKPHGKVYS